jgi:hypothetical protein
MRLIPRNSAARTTWTEMASRGTRGKNGVRYPYCSSSPMLRRIRITQRFTRKKRKRNIMLALEATCRVGRSVATRRTITPVAIRANHGVLRLLEIRENGSGSIRSRPRA